MFRLKTFLSSVTAAFLAVVASGPLFAESSRCGEEACMGASANKTKVEAVLNAWKAGDGTALQALLDDGIEWTIAGNSLASGTTRGRSELMSKVLGPFGARFSQSQDRFRPRAVRGIYGDGDTVIAHFDAAGVSNDGQPYSNSYVWILTMRDGKAIRATAFFDSIAFDNLWRRVQPAEN